MIVTVNGRFKDILYSRDGEPVIQRDWCSNTIVYGCLDLIAELLMNRPKKRGILYWAVGEGNKGWDSDMPDPDPATKRLVREIYRKPVRPERDFIYHPDRRTIEIGVDFRINEAAGTLREFGLFGGDATSAPDTGLMIDYKIHPKIVKGNLDTLKRRLLLTLALTSLFRSDIEDIEGIGRKYGARLREIEPHVVTLKDLSRIDETSITIDGVSRPRLKLWKDMAVLMTAIEGLDGNGAEILVKGGGVHAPAELAAMDTPEKLDKFHTKCVKAAGKIRIPRDYVAKQFTREKVEEWVKTAAGK